MKQGQPECNILFSNERRKYFKRMPAGHAGVICQNGSSRGMREEIELTNE
jgi:hypothetical protein